MERSYPSIVVEIATIRKKDSERFEMLIKESARGRPILFNRLFLTDTDTDLFSITDTDI